MNPSPLGQLLFDFIYILMLGGFFFTATWVVAKLLNNWSIVDVAWRERSGLTRLAWFVALMLLGNFAIAGYALLCLFQAPSDASLDVIFFTRKQA